MRKFLNWVLLVPLAVILVVFAVANRHAVTVSFDPFDTRDPGLGVTLPLFVVIIAVAILGVVTGGIATWIAQRHWRRAARRHEAEAVEAKSELADVRSAMARQTMARAAGLPPPASTATALEDRPRLTI